jgi:ParB family transcriptional regulator, chromosome partitioning protein
VKRKPLCDVPIAEIRIVNPRTRSRVRFRAIVSSIESVGLKKPITVTKRPLAGDGTQYDLVCGQGRIEAFLALGQVTIPANVIEASQEDQFVMSLVENIARRPPSNRALLREVLNLKERGYHSREIATKLGREVDYIDAIVHLIEHDEAFLVEAVEANRIPVTIAVLISSADDPGVQTALSEAYESGALRGARFKEAKRIIARYSAKRLESGQPGLRRRLSGEALVREYQQRTREQQALVKRAALIRERLVLLKSVTRTLLEDEHFVTLLRAEQLQDMPEQLVDEKVQQTRK